MLATHNFYGYDKPMFDNFMLHARRNKHGDGYKSESYLENF